MELQSAHIKLGQNGRMVIPAAYRERLDLHEGDELALLLENGDSLRLMSLSAATHHARSVFEPLKKKNVKKSVVDDFIRERREAAKKEGD